MTHKRELNDVDPDTEVKNEFERASDLGSGGAEEMIEKLEEYTDRSPRLSGGDVDAAWEDSDVGEESVGGGNPTPDQDIVEELGEAVGITYQDNEPLGTEEKLNKRDRDRWELDPASSDDNE